MIPSSKWFPSGLQDRAAWMRNFATQFSAYAGSLGFTGTDITAVNQDTEDFQSIAATTVAARGFERAVIEYRISLTEGENGDSQPVFPSENFAGPPNDRPAGMFERIDRLRRRILTAPAYTSEIGIALGIVPAASGEMQETRLKPVIRTSPSHSGYKFKLDATRLGQPGFQVQIQRKGSSAWETAAFATSNPVEVAVTPTTPGDPERILVRVFLLKNNVEVGEPSDPVYVTINP